MEQPTTTVYVVSDIVQWDYAKQIHITPKFQRRKVWSHKAKSYLIDTMIRKMPMPPIYVRPILDLKHRRTIREVVDGQQRVSAVLDFIQNKFPILPTHNSDLGGKVFDELPDEVKQSILSYKFTANMLESISDAEVLEIFSRINTYSVPLNNQELRNAKYFGAMKQSIYKIAHNHYKFFVDNKIITDAKIARMGDAEVVSELMSAIVNGIGETSNKTLSALYEKYDDEFPFKDKYELAFTKTIDRIGNIFEGKLKESNFRRIPLFYSLFSICFYDMYTKNTDTNEIKEKKSQISDKVLRSVIGIIDDAIENDFSNEGWREFIDATGKGTASNKSRQLRNKFIIELINNESAN